MKDSPPAVAPSVDLHGRSFFEIKLVCNFFRMNYECILFKKKINKKSAFYHCSHSEEREKKPHSGVVEIL